MVYDCPSCGRESKLYFNLKAFQYDEEILLGRCFSGDCATVYSSKSFLRELGADESEVSDVHEETLTSSLEDMAEIEILTKKSYTVTKEVLPVISHSFLPIASMPESAPPLLAESLEYR